MVSFFLISSLVELPFVIIGFSLSAYLLSGYSASLTAAKKGNGFLSGPQNPFTIGSTVFSVPATTSRSGTRSTTSFDDFPTSALFSTDSSDDSTTDLFGTGTDTSDLFGGLDTSDLFGSYSTYGNLFTDSDYSALLSQYSDLFGSSFRKRTAPTPVVGGNPAEAVVKRAVATPAPAPRVQKRRRDNREAAVAVALQKRASPSTSLSQLKSRLSAVLAFVVLLMLCFLARMAIIPLFLFLHHKRSSDDTYGRPNVYDSSQANTVPTGPSARTVSVLRTFLAVSAALLAATFLVGIISFALQGAFFTVAGPVSAALIAFWVLSLVVGAGTIVLLLLELRNSKSAENNAVYGGQETKQSYNAAAPATTADPTAGAGAYTYGAPSHDPNTADQYSGHQEAAATTHHDAGHYAAPAAGAAAAAGVASTYPANGHHAEYPAAGGAMPASSYPDANQNSFPQQQQHQLYETYQNDAGAGAHEQQAANAHYQVGQYVPRDVNGAQTSSSPPPPLNDGAQVTRKASLRKSVPSIDGVHAGHEQTLATDAAAGTSAGQSVQPGGGVTMTEGATYRAVPDGKGGMTLQQV